MILKELINKSTYGFIGYIGKEEDLHTLNQLLNYNKEIISEFSQVIAAFNYDGEFQQYTEQIINSIFPGSIVLHSPQNRGYNFGYCDLDNLIFDYCKSNNLPWLCKSAQDMVLAKELLDTPIQEADFYYYNGIGYGGMEKYNFDRDRIIREDFVPQTNFYFINVSKTDYLISKEYLDETYTQIKNIPNYNGKTWEYIPGWTCERFLKGCVERNKLNKYHLIEGKTYSNLLDLVEKAPLYDPSHKNLMIQGACHYHYMQQPITVVK